MKGRGVGVGGGSHHHNNKPNNSERWNFCVFFSPVILLSTVTLCPPPGGRQVVTFLLPPTSCLALGNAAAIRWEINVVPQRGVRRFKFHLSPFPGHSWEACNLPVNHEHSRLYSDM